MKICLPSFVISIAFILMIVSDFIGHGKIFSSFLSDKEKIFTSPKTSPVIRLFSKYFIHVNNSFG